MIRGFRNSALVSGAPTSAAKNSRLFRDMLSTLALRGQGRIALLQLTRRVRVQ